MDWKRISRIRLEDVRDKFIRSQFGFIIAVLVVLLILGLVLAFVRLPQTTPGKQWRNSGLALAAVAALWIYRVWNRKRTLGRSGPARRRLHASSSRPIPHLAVTDFEPPEDRDWAGGRIEFSHRADVSDRWFLAVSVSLVFGMFGWMFFSLPNLTGVDSTGVGDRARALLLLAVMPVAFLVWAITGTVRSRKTGVSSFQMKAGPGIIGRQLLGVIEMPANNCPQDAVEIELICLRQDSEGDCAVLQTLVPRERPAIRAAATIGQRLEIPVSIPIPPESPPTGRGDSDECIRWVLVARAPRSRYQAEFEVPVVRANF